MTHSYELNKEDIEKIIAERFNCDTRCVLLRTETKHEFGGCKETITATVKIRDFVSLQSIASMQPNGSNDRYKQMEVLDGWTKGF